MVTALYDSYCVLCQQTRRIVTRLDWRGRIEFLDLHEHEAVYARFPHLADYDLAGEIHVVMPDGAVQGGFYGMRAMLRALPLAYPLWLLLMLPGMDWIGTRIYGFIARNRYSINRFFGVELPDCEGGFCKLPD